ncbi:hypothetical protein LCGC14_2206430 [marine sediment metagenome]|uniref:Biopolymer transport protein ExbD/TolR n=1 Tax=marine sediment metagenome TaxID=412755 RepID=A0A0F9GB18_9ZZZZ
MHSEQIEEPDVTPLININLVLLVMVLAMASHSARLLPLEMPKAKDDARTEFVEMDQAVGLRVFKDGSYGMAGRQGLKAGDLPEAIDQLDPGRIILISMDPKAKYESLVRALDVIMAKPDLQVAFGSAGGPAVRIPASAPAPK